MGVSISNIQKKAWELASRISAPKSLATVFAESPQDGRPHVEIHSGEFHLVIKERGSVFSVKKTRDPDILLYWLFRSITSQMAQEYELRHRDYHQDSRRIIFSKQLELMAKLCSSWCSLLKDEIETILAENPYMDRHG